MVNNKEEPLTNEKTLEEIFPPESYGYETRRESFTELKFRLTLESGKEHTLVFFQGGHNVLNSYEEEVQEILRTMDEVLRKLRIKCPIAKVWRY